MSDCDEKMRAREKMKVRGLPLVLLMVITISCAPAVKQKQPDAREILQMRQQMVEELVRKRDYSNATPILRDLVERLPKNARMHLLLGVVLREKGAYDAAEKEIRTSLKLAPRSAAAHTALGAVLLKRGRYEQAERAHREAVSIAPRVARHHNDLGFCLLVQRKMDEARRELTEAIRLDPDLRVAFNNLGFLLGLTGDMDGAMKAFSQAGGRAMALTNMGYVEELRGRPEHARRYYERALQHRKDYKPALHNLRALDPGRWGDNSGEGAANDDVQSISEKTKQPQKSGSGAADRRGADPAAGRLQPDRLHQGRAPGVVDR